MSCQARDFDVLAVVIPARNEQRLLPRCLTAMAAAVMYLGRTADPPALRIIVVVDASDDETVQISMRWPGVETLVSDAGRVGAARRRGVDHLIRSSPDVELRRIWISTTDADSAVPPDWLSTMLHHARTGVEMVLGTVRPDPDELAAGLMAAWRLRHTVTDGHPHVHGANLGVRGDTYCSAGGFRETAAHEDVLLAAAVQRLGGRILSAAASPVLTSARTAGRAEAGLARYLVELDAEEAQREA